MNRHDRRAAAARERKNTGYLGRVITAMQDKMGKPGVATASIFHDNWCELYQGKGPNCTCDPDISIQEYDKTNNPTDEVIVVDRAGQAERIKKS